MTKDNKLQNTTYLFAGLFLLFFLLSQFHIKGFWTISPVATGLWLGWIGIMIGRKLSCLWKVIAGVLTVLIGVLCFRFLQLQVNAFSRVYGLFIGVASLLIGIALPKVKEPDDIVETLVLCSVFVILFGTLHFIEQRMYAAVWLDDGFLYPLHDVVFLVALVAKYVPIVALIYYAAQLALCSGCQRIAEQKWFRIVVLILSIVVFGRLLWELSLLRQATLAKDILLFVMQPLVIISIFHFAKKGWNDGKTA